MPPSSTFSSPSHWPSLTMERKGSGNECTVRDQSMIYVQWTTRFWSGLLNTKQKIQMILPKTERSCRLFSWHSFSYGSGTQLPRAWVVNVGWYPHFCLMNHCRGHFHSTSPFRPNSLPLLCMGRKLRAAALGGKRHPLEIMQCPHCPLSQVDEKIQISP